MTQPVRQPNPRRRVAYPGRNVALSSQPAQLRLLPHLPCETEQSVSGPHTAGWIAEPIKKSGHEGISEASGAAQKLHLVPVEIVLGGRGNRAIPASTASRRCRGRSVIRSLGFKVAHQAG